MDENGPFIVDLPIYLLNMVIFRSYVSLPKGISCLYIYLTANCRPSINPTTASPLPQQPSHQCHLSISFQIQPTGAPSNPQHHGTIYPLVMKHGNGQFTIHDFSRKKHQFIHHWGFFSQPRLMTPKGKPCSLVSTSLTDHCRGWRLTSKLSASLKRSVAGCWFRLYIFAFHQSTRDDDDDLPSNNQFWLLKNGMIQSLTATVFQWLNRQVACFSFSCQ